MYNKKIESLKDTIRNALVGVVLYRAPIVDTLAYETINKLDTLLLRVGSMEPLTEIDQRLRFAVEAILNIQTDVMTLQTPQKRREISSAHLAWSFEKDLSKGDDAVAVLAQLEETSDHQKSVVVKHLRLLAFHHLHA